MICRTIFIKLRDPEVSRRSEIAAELTNRWSLAGLTGRLKTGLPADESAADAWDLYIETSAESLDQMNDILSAAAWKDDLWPWLEQLAVVTKAWNFAVD